MAKYNDERGRLTSKGIEALYADFDAGKLKLRELAEKYNLSMPGICQRKRMWKVSA